MRRRNPEARARLLPPHRRRPTAPSSRPLPPQRGDRQGWPAAHQLRLPLRDVHGLRGEVPRQQVPGAARGRRLLLAHLQGDGRARRRRRLCPHKGRAGAARPRGRLRRQLARVDGCHAGGRRVPGAGWKSRGLVLLAGQYAAACLPTSLHATLASFTGICSRRTCPSEPVLMKCAHMWQSACALHTLPHPHQPQPLAPPVSSTPLCVPGLQPPEPVLRAAVRLPGGARHRVHHQARRGHLRVHPERQVWHPGQVAAAREGVCWGLCCAVVADTGRPQRGWVLHGVPGVGLQDEQCRCGAGRSAPWPSLPIACWNKRMCADLLQPSSRPIAASSLMCMPPVPLNR